MKKLLFVSTMLGCIVSIFVVMYHLQPQHTWLPEVTPVGLVNKATAKPTTPPIQLRKKNKPAMLFLGLSRTLQYGKTKLFQTDVRSLWKQFLAKKSGYPIQHRNDSKVYAIYSSYSMKSVRLTLGYRVKSFRDQHHGWKKLSIKPLSYMVLQGKGKWEPAIKMLWKHAQTNKIKRNYTAELEVYPSTLFSKPGGAVELWLSSHN